MASSTSTIHNSLSPTSLNLVLLYLILLTTTTKIHTKKEEVEWESVRKESIIILYSWSLSLWVSWSSSSSFSTLTGMNLNFVGRSLSPSNYPCSCFISVTMLLCMMRWTIAIRLYSEFIGGYCNTLVIVNYFYFNLVILSLRILKNIEDVNVF